MPSIKIDHCLVCDTVRPELGNKISLLGFFGVAPNVEVRPEKLDLPVNELTFVLVGSTSGAAGSVEVIFELFDWSDHLIVASPTQSQQLQPAERSNFVFGIRLVKFPHVGRYKLRLRVDGRPVYNTNFLIAAGESPARVS